MKEIQLPDYLSSRYKTWLHLYLEIQKIFAERGEIINEETTIKLYELGDYEEQKMLRQYSEEVIYFYQNFPIKIIKSRALDYVLSKLPSFEKMYEVGGKAMSGMHADQTMYEVFNALLDVCPTNRR
ncbi:MAG: hypothetical protein JSR97_09360 [Verrucomicrobia bacterium]|nr:hypothetical protein [Verrucomicrobiota bacterium]